MTKKILSLALSMLLVNLISVHHVSAGPREEERARLVEKVRAGVARLGTGTQARVEVKLLDRSKLKGYISEAGEDHFVVVGAGTGVATPVSYPQVAQVKGNNLSTGVKIAITAGLFVFLLILLARNNT
jgi:hypothetical protein